LSENSQNAVKDGSFSQWNGGESDQSSTLFSCYRSSRNINKHSKGTNV